jgi:DNA-binding HxlR family transcriptional regulator
MQNRSRKSRNSGHPVARNSGRTVARNSGHAVNRNPGRPVSRTPSRPVSHRSGCPISIALDLLGDTWSLLIVRDMMFKGFRTFNEFRTGDERIASNILTDRLACLEASGIVTKEPSQTDGRRYVYRLTPKGLDLAPVLIELTLWSARHEKTDAPAAILKQMRENRSALIAMVRKSCLER